MSTKRPAQNWQIIMGDGSLVWLSIHLSTWAVGIWLSRKIWSSPVTNIAEGVVTFARMVLVTERLPLNQMRTWPVPRFATKTVFIVLTKTAWGILPTTEVLAKVVAFGFQDALGQNLGWLNDRTRVRYRLSMNSEKNHSTGSKKEDGNGRKADKTLA